LLAVAFYHLADVTGRAGKTSRIGGPLETRKLLQLKQLIASGECFNYTTETAFSVFPDEMHRDKSTERVSSAKLGNLAPRTLPGWKEPKVATVGQGG